MIDKTLTVLKEEVNAWLELKNGVSEDKVVLTNVATEDGSWAIPEDKLGMSLVKIEEERVLKDQGLAHKKADGKVDYYNPELRFNLYVLVTANFPNGDTENDNSKYVEGLKQLSHVISFFQQKHVFTNTNTPVMADIDSNLQKLIVELYYYSFEQQDNLWTVIGAKYLPSVLYKVRLVTFQEGAVKDQAPSVGEMEFNVLGG